MMKKILIVVFCFLVLGLSAQEPYKSVVQFKVMAGVNMPMTKLLDGRITDNLIDFEQKASFYPQFVSIDVFFFKRWGLGFNLYNSLYPSPANKENLFREASKSEYNDDYFVSAEFYNDYHDNFMTKGLRKVSVSLIYRFETEKFYAYPRLSLGQMSFDHKTADVRVKKKNSHEEIQIRYQSNLPNSEAFFLTSASCSLGYKLRKRIFLNFDFMTSHYKADFTLTKRTTHILTGETTTEPIRYNKHMFDFSFAFGLIFAI